MTRVEKLTYRSMADQAAEALSAYIITEGLQPGGLLPLRGPASRAVRCQPAGDPRGAPRARRHRPYRDREGQGVRRPADRRKPAPRLLRPGGEHGSSIRSSSSWRFDAGSNWRARGWPRPAGPRRRGRCSPSSRSGCGSAIDDPDTYAELDVEFHLAIAAASHNRMIRHLVSSLRGALHETIREGLRARQSRAQFERVQQLHEELCRRVVAGDAPGAQKAMLAHFDEAVDVLVRRRGTPGDGGTARRGR